MTRELRVVPEPDLKRQTAAALAEHLQAVLAGAPFATLALSGGQTPRGLYEALAETYAATVPWSRVHLFWGDERYVPHDDARSNYRLVEEALLRRIAIPAGNVHPMPTAERDPAAAAAAYERELRGVFSENPPRFDLILLGMGPDGHTASLFPGGAALQEHERWVRDVRAPVEPPIRLTLTLPVLNAAQLVFFLVAGADKAETFRRVWADTSVPPTYPAAAVRPPDGRVIWWTDPAAAALFNV